MQERCAIQFEVPGYVQPLQRTVYSNYVTAPETRAYKQLVGLQGRLAMKGRALLTSFLGLEISILCRTPPSWSKKKAALALEGKLFPTHCDIDNQIKAIQDALTKVVYEDDRLINRLTATRAYATEDKAVISVVELV